MTVRVLIADDHPVFLDGLRTLLATAKDVEIVGEVATGAGVVDACAQLRPDVVIMDIQMPDLNGIEATRRITAATPGVGVLVLTMFEDDEAVFAAMRAGARGYLLKGARQAEIVRAVHVVADGEAIFGRSVAERIIAFFTTARPAGLPGAFPELTERERVVLELLARGETNDVIAQRLFLSSKTVRNYVSNVFGKLQVADRAAAVVQARRAGFGEGEA
ncbi:MAG: response regulator transcription factor [Candidatus Dormibacteraeota bacterium]|uniref:Response regulator transcription factor n=1 Tax=Candidatus Dormiibacter inghamiae TaxID=3127013 RepID=A0A934K541_9BACT|nr:response regulator transcription factor [Candidatus Dormibacteraeota bacterium]MBJ7605573.1 response regulator transcription factor [Candidatus Dormibacteraeota bacterium]